MSKESLLDNLAPLAQAHVPILHLCGSLDPALADKHPSRGKESTGPLAGR